MNKNKELVFTYKVRNLVLIFIDFPSPSYRYVSVYSMKPPTITSELIGFGIISISELIDYHNHIDYTTDY